MRAVGMIEIGEDLAFGAEPGQQILCIQTAPNEFEGDPLFELIIIAAGEVNGPHSTAPDLMQNPTSRRNCRRKSRHHWPGRGVCRREIPDGIYQVVVTGARPASFECERSLSSVARLPWRPAAVDPLCGCRNRSITLRAMTRILGGKRTR